MHLYHDLSQMPVKLIWTMLNTCRWPNISFTIIVDNCFVENLPQRSLVPEQTMRRRAHVGAL